MNKKTFASVSSKPDTINPAGAPAFALKSKEKLVNLAVNGFINDTYYTSADQIVEMLSDAVNEVSPEFAAKTAIYAKTKGAIKDAPAYILAAISKGEHMEVVRRAFPKVISNGKMLRNYVQVIRSGKTKRTSFGSGPKKLVNKWLLSRNDRQLLNDSIGNSPSLKDVILLTHPNTSEREAIFKYILGFNVPKTKLPAILKSLENARSGKGKVNWELLAELDFRHVDNIPELPIDFWNAWAERCSYHALRMNLNTLQRKGAFKDAAFTKMIANRLTDEDEIKKANQFPFQFFAAYSNTTDLPAAITRALKKAFEISMKAYSVPLPENGVILIDGSGSMYTPITGVTSGKSSVITCAQTAALFGCFAAKNVTNPTIAVFENRVKPQSITVTDDPLSFADKLTAGGGTNTHAALEYAYKQNPDFVYVVSDNEGWVRESVYDNSHNVIKAMVKQNPKIKIVLHNIVPGMTTPSKTTKNVLNIGGFSNDLMEKIAAFVNNENSMEKIISEIEQISL